MEKRKKGLLSAAFVCAFVFLFNPNINIVDILPDFLGYGILCVALSKLAELNENIELAQKGFFRALCLDVAKLICVLVIIPTQNPDEQNTMLLLGSFTFAVLELIILIPAYGNLFSGFINLAYKFDSVSILSKGKGFSEKNRTEKIRSFTVIFLILKTAMSTLPEFAVLSTHTHEDVPNAFSLYSFVGLFRLFAIVVAFIVGVIWLLRIIVYFVRVIKDTAFSGALLEEYNVNVLPRKGLFIRKSVKLMSLFFCMAALLCVDLRIGGFNVLFDTLAAVALIAAVLTTRKYIGKSYKSIIPFIVYGVISFIAVIFEFRFFGEHYYSAIWRDNEAYNAYIIMLVWSVLDAVAFLWAAWQMSSMLRTVIKEHTGFYVPGASINVDDKIKKVHSELNKKVYLLWGAAVLSAAADLLYDFGAHAMKFALFVNTVCSLIFFVAVFYVTDAVGEEVESKYMLE